MSRAAEDRAWNVLTRLDSYFTLASIKSALILPADAVLLAVTVAGLYQLRSTATACPLTGTPAVALGVMLVSTLISVGFALVATAAFLKSGNRPGDYLSLVFFGSVRSMDSVTYRSAFADCESDAFTDDVLQQVHLLSGALHNKYVLLNWSVVFCAIGYAALVAVALAMLGGF